MRYYDCDECGEEKSGTPETIEDVVVGNLKIAIMVYKNNNNYESVDLCECCRKRAIDDLRVKLNESAGTK